MGDGGELGGVVHVGEALGAGDLVERGSVPVYRVDDTETVINMTAEPPPAPGRRGPPPIPGPMRRRPAAATWCRASTRRCSRRSPTWTSRTSSTSRPSSAATTRRPPGNIGAVILLEDHGTLLVVLHAIVGAATVALSTHFFLWLRKWTAGRGRGPGVRWFAVVAPAV